MLLQFEVVLNSLSVKMIQIVLVRLFSQLLLSDTLLRQECLEAKLKGVSRENVSTN